MKSHDELEDHLQPTQVCEPTEKTIVEPLGEGLRNQLVDIVRTAQRELFQSYEAQRLSQRSQAGLDHDPGVLTTENPVQMGQGNVEPGLEAFNMPPLTSDEDWLNQFLPFLGAPPSGSDSGYGSNLLGESSHVHNSYRGEVAEKPEELPSSAILGIH